MSNDIGITTWPQREPTDHERIQKLERQVDALRRVVSELTYGVAIRSVISFDENERIVGRLNAAFPDTAVDAEENE